MLALPKVAVPIPWSHYPEWGYTASTRLLAGGYNAAKLPRYARMDVGWRRKSEVSWFGGGSVTLYASVANLLNRSNVVGWNLDRVRGGFTQVARGGLPVIPSFGAEFRF